MKKDAAPGIDGVAMDMKLTERLFEVWVALFTICWEVGMVPSLWRESVMVPVPKGKAKGVRCEHFPRHFFNFPGQLGGMQDPGTKTVKCGRGDRSHSRRTRWLS